MTDIIYTIVDEAPELASGSFLPIIQKFAGAAGVEVGTKDISLAARILALFDLHSDDLAKSHLLQRFIPLLRKLDYCLTFSFFFGRF